MESVTGPEDELGSDSVLVYQCDMLSPFEDGIEPTLLEDNTNLREACTEPGYKMVPSRMEMHTFRIPCHRCLQPFQAWALYAPVGCVVGLNWNESTNQYERRDSEGPDFLELPGYAMHIRALPPRVLEFLRHELGSHPWTKMQTHADGPEYFSNRCPRCGAIHGDYYLHLEANQHQFWPSRASGVRKLEFEPTYLFMFYGEFRPLRPSAAAMEYVVDDGSLPPEGGLMLGCAFCNWCAVIQEGKARPLSRRCDDCLVKSPFLTAAFAVVEEMDLVGISEPDNPFAGAEPL